LADNIQETFGITPLEAMASGLPVVVSDWDGYKDTVPHGEVGFRISTYMAPTGFGTELALRHQLGVINYDFYIGSASLATVVDPNELKVAFELLASQKNLRIEMGQKAQKLIREKYDHNQIIKSYIRLSETLQNIRLSSNSERKMLTLSNSPNRIDPFQRFSKFPTSTLDMQSKVICKKKFEDLNQLLNLNLASYEINTNPNKRITIIKLYKYITENHVLSLEDLLLNTECMNENGINCLMWLYKFDYLFFDYKKN
jgi:hypothetical protein